MQACQTVIGQIHDNQPIRTKWGIFYATRTCPSSPDHAFVKPLPRGRRMAFIINASMSEMHIFIQLSRFIVALAELPWENLLAKALLNGGLLWK